MSPDKVEVRATNLCPKEHTMTTATMALAELAEKGADVDVLRQMVQFMAQFYNTAFIAILQSTSHQ